MSWQFVYAWSKKIHKLTMWLVVVLGSWMMFSGYVMHKELEGETIPFLNIDTLFVRFWHNKISQIFLVVFALQMLTGLLMWAAPKILDIVRRNKIA